MRRLWTIAICVYDSLMAIKSTQVFPVRVVRDAVSITGLCRIIKHEHWKDEPGDEGVPQREVLLIDERGEVVLRITKFFRHLLVESDGEFETTDRMLKLTPKNMQDLAEYILAQPQRGQHLLNAALRYIDLNAEND